MKSIFLLVIIVLPILMLQSAFAVPLQAYPHSTPPTQVPLLTTNESSTNEIVNVIVINASYGVPSWAYPCSPSPKNFSFSIDNRTEDIVSVISPEPPFVITEMPVPRLDNEFYANETEHDEDLVSSIEKYKSDESENGTEVGLISPPPDEHDTEETEFASDKSSTNKTESSTGENETVFPTPKQTPSPVPPPPDEYSKPTPENFENPQKTLKYAPKVYKGEGGMGNKSKSSPVPHLPVDVFGFLALTAILAFLCGYSILKKHYLISYSILAIAIFSVYMFFTTKVKCFPLDLHTFLEAGSLSILIVYQCVAIKSLFAKMKPTFDKLMPLLKDNQFQYYLDRKVQQKSVMSYFVMLLIIIPFILFEFIRFWRWEKSIGPMPPYFLLHEPSNHWALALDIFNHIVGYLMLVLLALIVWKIITLIIVVNAFGKTTSINIDMFNIDEMGGLMPLRNFILLIISNYFIIIALAIVSYISPTAIISWEAIFLIFIMLFLGILLFVLTLRTIIKSINNGLKLELSKINERQKNAYTKLLTITSNSVPNWSKDDLEKLSLSFNILEKEKTKIKLIRRRRYNLGTMVTFVGSFLIPLITLIEKLRLIEYFTKFL
jgi:hypothetical protein